MMSQGRWLLMTNSDVAPINFPAVNGNYLSQGRFLRFYFGDGWVGAACGLELPPPDIVWIEADALNENR